MISIILPTYNSFQFLKERVDTILNQTFSDWECIVVDGYSTDGSWEYLQQYSSDSRFRFYQLAPNGVYNALNKGIQEATGSFIYFATSDDTMGVDCLEKLHTGLENHKECDIAHCCLTIIDESGHNTKNQWINWPKVKFYGDLINKEHIRIAPFDGLVHSGWNTVYTSLTQLLIKKRVFDKLGYFEENLGSTADFEWGMRSSLVFNTLHIPEYLSTWRKHSNQLSDDRYFETAGFAEHLLRMQKLALKKAEMHNDNLKLNLIKLGFNYNAQLFLKSKSVLRKMRCIFNFIPLFNNLFYLKQTLKLVLMKKNNIQRLVNYLLIDHKVLDNIVKG